MLGLSDLHEDPFKSEEYLEKPLISQNFAITNGNWVTYFNIFLYWL